MGSIQSSDIISLCIWTIDWRGVSITMNHLVIYNEIVDLHPDIKIPAMKCFANFAMNQGPPIKVMYSRNVIYGILGIGYENSQLIADCVQYDWFNGYYIFGGTEKKLS